MDWLYSITVKGMASSEKNIIKCTSKWSEYIPRWSDEYIIPFTVIEYNQYIYSTRLIQLYYHPTHTTSNHSLYSQHYYIVNHDGTFYNKVYHMTTRTNS